LTQRRREQAFYAGVNRPRELSHDVQALSRLLERRGTLREQGADIRGVILEYELKREFREWLQERIAAVRTVTDGRSRPARNRRLGTRHDLRYFDDVVHFPDFRIEYELHGRDQHEDVEVVTEHYRARSASVAERDFTCYGGAVAAVGVVDAD